MSRSAADALLGEPCHRLQILSQGSSKQRTCCACGESIPPGSYHSPSPLVVVHRRSAETYSELALCPLCAAGIEFQGRAISFERSDVWSPKGWRTELEAERRVVQQANLVVWKAQAAEMDRRRAERDRLAAAGREATIHEPCCWKARDAHEVERVAVWLVDLAKHVTGEDMGPGHALYELLGWAREVFAEHGTEGDAVKTVHGELFDARPLPRRLARRVVQDLGPLAPMYSIDLSAPS